MKIHKQTLGGSIYSGLQMGPHVGQKNWCIETADAPGRLDLYRRTIDLTSTTATLEMPDWFPDLVKDVMVQGECTENTTHNMEC